MSENAECKALEAPGQAWLVGEVDSHRWMSCDSGGPIYKESPDLALKFADKASAEVFAQACSASARGEINFQVEDHLWGTP